MCQLPAEIGLDAEVARFKRLQIVSPPVVEPEARPEPTISVSRTPATALEALICSFDWPCQTALCIARAESGLSPTAYNAASGTTGLFQLRPTSQGRRVALMGYTWADMYDALANATVAYAIWHGDLEQGEVSGFWAWDGSPQCWAY